MKKLYFLVIVLFVVGNIQGQNPSDIIYIPDPVFKNKLINESNYFVSDGSGNFLTLDINNDSEIQISEALSVVTMNLDWEEGIYSLEGIQSFSNLKSLSCMDIDISVLDLTGLINLEYVNASSCNLTDIAVSDLPSLKKLFFSQNSISTLDLSGLPNVEELDCSSNLMLQLDVTMLPKLRQLDCSNNGMTSLNITGLSKLRHLYCNSNALTTLDEVCLKKLYILSCNNNLFLSLNFENSTSIVQLSCNENLLTSLVLAGSSIRNLDCQNNQLTALDFSNIPYLEDINCSYNQLTTLDFSSSNYLSYLDASHNQLQSLFIKNGKSQSIQDNYFSNNPDLQYICADENEISELQQLLFLANCNINSYCSFIPGGIFYTINGNNKINTDNTTCDASDVSMPNLKFKITNSNETGTILSNATGEYSIPVQAGTHSITPVLENPNYFNISPSTLNVTFPATASPFIQNFCITPNGVHPDLEVVILPTTPSRPGFDTDYKLIIKNKGNIQQSGSVTFVYDDAVLDYVIANPLFTTQATGSLTWDFDNLEPFETREITMTLNVNSPMETPAVNGDDILNYTATIMSDQVDEFPLDNTFTLPQIVVNSFDPNDKVCLEGKSITPDMIGKYVHYIIRFENTGTFAAQNIVVKDMIDTTKFDVSSLIALNGSHSYVTRITENKVEFIFENINLPFDDANNDGYVVFKIKTLPDLVLGDSFSNSASIYFDYNHPIVTEPAVTMFAELGREDFVFNNYFTLYPNPTSEILNITSKQAIELQSISIYNMLGQMVISVPNGKGITNIDVANLSAGNYFIKVVSDRGTANTKFIKK